MHILLYKIKDFFIPHTEKDKVKVIHTFGFVFIIPPLSI